MPWQILVWIKAGEYLGDNRNNLTIDWTVVYIIGLILTY